MISNNIPYTQRAIVHNKPIEDVYESVTMWLVDNHCVIKHEDSPTILEARYEAEIPLFQTGPRDNLPKDLQVRVSEFGEDVLLYFTISQTLLGKGENGYLYWGQRLQELYKELGVELTESVWRDLYPDRAIKDTVKRKTRILIAFIAISIILVAAMALNRPDAAAMYTLVLMIPVSLLIYWDMLAHKKLLTIPT